MKRILLALAIGALALPLAAPQAKSADVSIDFFYDNLSGGNWIEVGDYGYCWQPDVTVSDPDWRPYTDGYWAYTDVGWTWISYEDFGWATYHYGRWMRVADYGWLWVPGSDLDWGPAWVSWRVGDDYIGWAPLPPRGPGIAYEGGPISGHVDIEFDIGPAYYNFVDVRYIGEPVLRNRIIDVHKNVTYIDRTVNVTNITYKNKTVYNYGPDLNFVDKHSSRPIQRLRIERQQNADIRAAVKGGAVTKVQGQNLVVAAPLQITRPAKQEAPTKVKARVAQPKLEKGWAEVGNEKAQTELKQKIKNQNLHRIPAPTAGAGVAAEISPAASDSTNVAASPGEKGKYKGERAGQVQPNATVAPATSSGTMTSPATERGLQHKGNRGEKAGQPSVPEPMNPPGGTRREAGKQKGEETSRTNLNSSKSNIYKSAAPNPGERSAEGLHRGRNEGKGEKGSPTPNP